MPNVVGMVEGNDPDLKADVVGAHLDHLGFLFRGAETMSHVMA